MIKLAGEDVVNREKGRGSALIDRETTDRRVEIELKLISP